MSEPRGLFEKVAGAILVILMAAFGYLARQLDNAHARINSLSERLAALEAANTSEHRTMRFDIRDLRRPDQLR